MDTELFKAWPRITRESPWKVTITEKLDGTNGCIIIQDGNIVGVQSRRRMITPSDDNYDFAKWVAANNDDLLSLGDGYHYGEWIGEGIQKNPHQITGREFYLFTTHRWQDGNPNRPKCCKVVPVLFEGILTPVLLDRIMSVLAAEGVANNVVKEGVIIYYHTFRNYTKYTFHNNKGKWEI